MGDKLKSLGRKTGDEMLWIIVLKSFHEFLGIQKAMHMPRAGRILRKDLGRS